MLNEFRKITLWWTLVTTFIHESIHAFFAAPFAQRVTVDVHPQAAVAQHKVKWKESAGRMPKLLSALGPLLAGVVALTVALWGGVFGTLPPGSVSELAALAIASVWWLALFHASPSDVRAALESGKDD
jgi:hypothetical protein